MPAKDSMLIGEMLAEEGLITHEQLEQCLKEKNKSGKFICQIVSDLGFAPEDKVFAVLSRQLRIPCVKIKERKIDKSILERVPAKFAIHYKLMPIELKDEIITIAVTDPLDVHTLDDVKLLLGCEVRACLAGEKDIIEAIKKYYGIGADTIENIIAETEPSARPDSAGAGAKDSDELVEDASIIKFVNQIIQQAFHDRATDIHIEPYEDELRVRYRIDGVLYDAAIPPTIKHFQPAIISRIKIMSNLNIAEHRLPQDGRMKIRAGKEDLDLRVSILPTPYGESVGIRLLSAKMLYSLE
nr:ATPase, T2SS/T4P/T4SS family [Candidatus Omnitrophota bacterium]